MQIKIKDKIYTTTEILKVYNTYSKLLSPTENSPGINNIYEFFFICSRELTLSQDMYRIFKLILGCKPSQENQLLEALNSVDNAKKKEVQDHQTATHSDSLPKSMPSDENSLSKNHDLVKQNKKEQKKSDREQGDSEFDFTLPRVFNEYKLGKIWKKLRLTSQKSPTNKLNIQQIVDTYAKDQVWHKIYQTSPYTSVFFLILRDISPTLSPYNRQINEIIDNLTRYSKFRIRQSTFQNFNDQDIKKWKSWVNEIPKNYGKKIVLLVTDGVGSIWMSPQAQNLIEQLSMKCQLIWCYPYPESLRKKTVLGNAIASADANSRKERFQIISCDIEGFKKIATQREYSFYKPLSAQRVNEISNTFAKQDIEYLVRQVKLSLPSVAYQLLCLVSLLEVFDPDLLYLLRKKYTSSESIHNETQVYCCGLIERVENDVFRMKPEAKSFIHGSYYFKNKILDEELKNVCNFVLEYMNKTPSHRKSLQSWKPQFKVIEQIIQSNDLQYESGKETVLEKLQTLTGSVDQTQIQNKSVEIDVRELLKNDKIENLSIIDLKSIVKQWSNTAKNTPEIQRAQNLGILVRFAKKIPKESIGLLTIYLQVESPKPTQHKDFQLQTSHYAPVIRNLIDTRSSIKDLLDIIELLAKNFPNEKSNSCASEELIKQCLSPAYRHMQDLLLATDTLQHWSSHITHQRFQLLIVALKTLLAFYFEDWQYSRSKATLYHIPVENTQIVKQIRNKCVGILVGLIHNSQLQLQLSAISTIQEIVKLKSQGLSEREIPLREILLQERKIFIRELGDLLHSESNFAILHSIEELFLQWWSSETPGTEDVEQHLQNTNWDNEYIVFKHFVSMYAIRSFDEIQQNAPVSNRRQWWLNHMFDYHKFRHEYDTDKLVKTLHDKYSTSLEIVSYLQKLSSLVKHFSKNSTPIIQKWVCLQRENFMDIRHRLWEKIPTEFKLDIEIGIDMSNDTYINDFAKNLCDDTSNINEIDLKNFLALLEIPRDTQNVYKWLYKIIDRNEKLRLIVLQKLSLIFQEPQQQELSIKLCQLYISQIEVLNYSEINSFHLLCHDKDFTNVNSEILSTFKSNLYDLLKVSPPFDWRVEDLLLFTCRTIDEILNFIDFKLKNKKDLQLDGVPIDGLKQFSQKINNDQDYIKIVNQVVEWLSQDYIYDVIDFMHPIASLKDSSDNVYLEKIVRDELQRKSTKKLSILFFLPLNQNNISLFIECIELLIINKEISTVEKILVGQTPNQSGGPVGKVSSKILARQQLFLEMKKQTDTKELQDIIQKQIEALSQLMDYSLEDAYFEQMDQFLEQLTTEQWKERLRKVTSEFVPTKIQSIKQVEAIFSCIARKLEFSTLDREHDDLHKTIFQQQMQLLTKKYDNGWYGPQTRRDSTNRDLGSRCIGDFWLWGLSDLISKEMIPVKAKDLFPMYKKLDSSWVRTLENTTSIESPTSDIFGNKPKKLEEDQCKSYRRLVDISFLLMPQINITTEDINLSLLLCPAYMIHSFLDNKKPDATMFIKKHHGFSVDSCILWYEPIIYLAKKHASNNLSAVATYLLQEIINIQSQQPHQRSILTIAQKLHRHYQDLFTFLLDHASIDDCEYPSTAIANYEEYKYLNSTPASWKNWYLDHIVGNIDKKESLITYIRTTDRKVEIESRYWLLIFDQDDENPISVRKIWENAPEIALSKAIQLLNEGSRHTKVWFSEVSDQQIYFLCEKVLEYMGTKNIALPDWFKTWYERNLQRDNSIEVLHDNLFQDRR